MAKKEVDSTIVIEPIKTETVQFAVVGTSPIILNRLSKKTREELLLPRGRKNAAQKQAELKHDPLQEFRDSPYIMPDGSPTYLGVMASAFKGAMMTAALDLPGTKKAQIGRLVYVVGDYVPIFGIPKLFMSITRSADINHTPDVRTRAIIPHWAALVTVRFVVPLMNAQAVGNLLAAAGVTAGIGDWRPEKGKGSYGQFRLAVVDDPELNSIIEEGGREAQMAAMDEPECYDRETEELFSWFLDEVVRRGKKVS